MSVSPALTAHSAGEDHRPFQCSVCRSRFTRHENLKRHASQHCRSSGGDAKTLACHLCAATFSRSDLRHRHLKRKHAFDREHQQRANTQRHGSHNSPGAATDAESQSSSPTGQVDSNDGLSGDNSLLAMLQFEPDQAVRQYFGTPDAYCQMPSASLATTQKSSVPRGLNDLPPLSVLTGDTAGLEGTNFSPSLFNYNFGRYEASDAWFPSKAQVSKGCELFFTHISPWAPFLHEPTFHSADAEEHSLLSMLCIAYQYGEDPDCGEQEGSGTALSDRCFHLAHNATPEADVSPNKLSLIQTYFLLQIYAMMYKCGSDYADFGLRTHAKMISLARTEGMLQPDTTAPASTKDLDALWLTFVKNESKKRTVFALHQLDALWYKLLSIPRQLSHLEVKHELPCPQLHWTASTSVEWAHMKLASENKPPPSYPEAVRRFLSSTDLARLAPFDSYGAINITHFLISSAREISGWCTMTGILNTERLEPLQASLLALGPFTGSDATWQSAMIEIQIWSSSHTGGVVGRSMDAMLHRLSDVAPVVEFICESNIATTIQPHIDWFLRYLDETVVPAAEAPWITLYAYKAFTIACQLVSKGQHGAMQLVGIKDGDTDGAVAWAKMVFGRRRRWQLGKIILSILDTR